MTTPRALAAVLAVAMLTACATGGSTVASPGTTAAAADGAFVWQDLITTDATAARQFYGALLGWEFEETSRGGRPYLIARTATGPVGGLVDVRDLKDAASQWVSYVSVADIDRALQQVQSAGGKVIVPPTDAKSGRASVVVDPQGAAIGLLTPAKPPSADPIQPLAAHFFWREYLAQDATKALAFYKNLFGYDGSSTDARLGMEYFVLRRDRPRAGLVQIPGSAPQIRPQWLPYLLADNPAALAAKVAGLGGRVLLEPGSDRRNGTLAIVADPTGGVVALQRYPL